MTLNTMTLTTLTLNTLTLNTLLSTIQSEESRGTGFVYRLQPPSLYNHRMLMTG